jgi:hypothetical protein
MWTVYLALVPLHLKMSLIAMVGAAAQGQNLSEEKEK